MMVNKKLCHLVEIRDLCERMISDGDLHDCDSQCEERGVDILTYGCNVCALNYLVNELDLYGEPVKGEEQ